MFSTADRLTRAPGVVSRTLDGQAVVLNVSSGTYIVLNEVGSRVWELIGEGTTVADVHAALLAEFDVASEVLEKDLLDVLQSFAERGLVIQERA